MKKLAGCLFLVQFFGIGFVVQNAQAAGVICSERQLREKIDANWSGDELLLGETKLYLEYFENLAEKKCKGQDKADESRILAKVQLIEQFLKDSEARQTPKNRVSQAYLVLAGLWGIIGDNYRTFGKSEGGKSFKALRKSVQVDSSNKEAWFPYGITIHAFDKRNGFIKGRIEASLKIKVRDEIRYCIENLATFRDDVKLMIVLEKLLSRVKNEDMTREWSELHRQVLADLPKLRSANPAEAKKADDRLGEH